MAYTVTRQQGIKSKSSEHSVILPPVDEDLTLPVDFIEDHPGGMAAIVRITPLEFIKRTDVEHLSSDGDEGVQRALSTAKAKSYFEAILDALNHGKNIINQRPSPIVNVNDVTFNGISLTVPVQVRFVVDDGQHLVDALKRLYSYQFNTSDPVEKLRIKTALEESLLTVKVLFGWELDSRREYFYRLNGLATPVSGSLAAFLGSEIGGGSKADQALKILMAEGNPFKNRISISGSGKGLFSYKTLLGYLDKYVTGATPEAMADTFAAFWTAVEETFPDQKELESSAFREGLIKAMHMLRNPDGLKQLAQGCGGRLSNFKPLMTSSGTGGQANQLFKAIVDVLDGTPLNGVVKPDFS